MSSQPQWLYCVQVTLTLTGVEGWGSGPAPCSLFPRTADSIWPSLWDRAGMREQGSHQPAGNLGADQKPSIPPPGRHNLTRVLGLCTA